MVDPSKVLVSVIETNLSTGKLVQTTNVKNCSDLAAMAKLYRQFNYLQAREWQSKRWIRYSRMTQIAREF